MRVLKHCLLSLTALLILSLAAHGASLSEPASLRERVPEDALAYLRVPNLWGLLTAPKGNVLQQALQDEQLQAQARSLEAAVQANLLSQMPPQAGPLLSLLLHHLRSPLEAVVLLPPQAPVPIPNVLVSAKLDIASIDELNALLRELVASAPPLQVLSEVSGEGYGVLMAPPLPVLLHYETATRTLTLMTGPAADEQLFRQTLAQLAPQPEHPMYTMERQIDTSAQGLFVWINAARVLPLVQQMGMPPDVAGELQKFGLLEARAAALGWGASQGKGRLKLLVDAPKGGLRLLLPDINNQLALTAAGEPGLVLLLSVPGADVLRAVEALMEAEGNTGDLQQLQEYKQHFIAQHGFSLEEGLGVLGPELMIFTDEAGEFLAVQVGDAARLEQLLQAVVDRFGLQHEIKSVDGRDYHHLLVPSLMAADELPGAGGGALMARLYARGKTHLYWLEDEGYLVFARVPQLLFDRQRHPERTSLRQWLAEQQRQDASASLLLFSVTLDNTPRYLYYAYLQILEYLGDLAQQRVDLFVLPSAMDLALPPAGSYGLQLDVAGPLTALEFTFENNPLDFLFSPNMSATVAVLGIMAAIAIPAYTDYVERAKAAQEEQQK